MYCYKDALEVETSAVGVVLAIIASAVVEGSGLFRPRLGGHVR